MDCQLPTRNLAGILKLELRISVEVAFSLYRHKLYIERESVSYTKDVVGQSSQALVLHIILCVS